VRHVLVTRASLSITALFLAASLAFAWLAGRPRATTGRAPAPYGERAFADHCRGCHEAEELAGPLRSAADAAAAAAAMEAFLSEHGESSAAEDRAIVEFLRGPQSGGGR
jgi:mono/diheme cytochrome c family protein